MKTKIILFAFLAQLLSITASAYDAEIDGIYYEFSGTEATVVYGDYRYSEPVSIPECVTYNGNIYEVTTIGQNAFSYCEDLTSIILPNNITTIDQYAFVHCRNITSIIIPEKVTSIGIHAFSGCKSLTSIVVEEGNKIYDSRDECNAIIETASNTLIVGCKNTIIPEDITAIGHSAFCQGGLTSISIPSNVISIGEYAFYECTNLTNLFIPKSVTLIEPHAFTDCSGLNSIVVEEGNSNYDSRNGCNALIETASNTLVKGCVNTIIPNSVTTIGTSSFRGCIGLSSIIIPDGVIAINDDAFYQCSDLTSITIPEGITSIGSYTFSSSGLTSIIFPESLIRIGFNAFLWCSALTSITIPKNVNYIDPTAFSGCSGLTSIFVNDENPFYDSRNGCNAIISKSSNTLIKGCETTIIPESITAIGEYAFYYCNGLESLTLPSTVTSIGNCAFQNCIGLNSIYLHSKIANIGNQAFFGCLGLTSISIPEGVTTIGNAAFASCSGLTSIKLPNSLSNLGRSAFSGCSNLITLTIPNRLTNINPWSFASCSNLRSIILPASVNYIGEHAFSDCYNLQELKVGMKTPITITEDVFKYSTYNNPTLYVPSDSKAAYESVDYWNDFNVIVEYKDVDVDNQTIVVGRSTTMDIDVNNFDSNLVAFQMDLTLPEGVSIEKDGCSLSSRITDKKQELTIGKLGDNVYRLTSSSLSLTPIDGNEGTLLSLELNASEDSEGGQATLSNIRFSTSESERVIMSDVSFDINVLHKFKLTYFVDGEEYMTDSITYKTPLAPEAEPTKDGYTFGGWSEIPETMPANDVEITGRFYFYGDVNTDEEVDVVDVVDIARFVVATPSEKFREKLADLNSDETVNLGDAVTLVNYIAGDQNFVKPMFAPTNYVECNDALSLKQNGKSLSLSLTNSRAYTAFQFDLYVSEESNIDHMLLSANRDQKHHLLYNKVSDGHYRVAALSTSNNTIRGNEGELLSFIIDDEPCTEVTISNIQFFDTKGNAYLFDAIGIDTETALDSVTTINNNEAGAVFDLQGRKLSKVKRGVNIVNGKALIVK